MIHRKRGLDTKKNKGPILCTPGVSGGGGGTGRWESTLFHVAGTTTAETLQPVQPTFKRLSVLRSAASQHVWLACAPPCATCHGA